MIFNKNKKLNIVAIAAIVFASLTFFVAWLIYKPLVVQKLSPEIDVIKNAQIGEIVEFSGTVNEFNDRCVVDAECWALVGKYVVSVNPGMVDAASRGYLPYGESDVWSSDVGKRVKVRAIKEDEFSLRIYGAENLYLLKINE